MNFPIRAIDFDYKRKLLFTGDEMGFMHKWDLSILLDKLDGVKEGEKKIINRDILEDLKSASGVH